MKRKLTLTAFDYEDEPGKEYLRLTFDVKKEEIKEVVKSRDFCLGSDYKISIPKDWESHKEMVLKHIKKGDLITHTRCMGVLEEHIFSGMDGVWICGNPTFRTVKHGGSKKRADDISPRNVTHINRVPVDALDFLKCTQEEQ